MDFWVNMYMYVEIMDTCTDEYDAAWQMATLQYCIL